LVSLRCWVNCFRSDPRNLSLLGFHGLDYLSSNEAISILAEIGVIFLLFEVGLESNIKDMVEVGAASFLVALAGVVTPPLLKISLARGDRLKEFRRLVAARAAERPRES
jgi:Kef-type K+ transport system membrane component KefB